MNQQIFNMVFPTKQRTQLLTLTEAADIFWRMDLINKGELHELALVKKSKNNLKKHTKNKKGSDYTDNSDAKYTEVKYYNSAYATLGGFKNKIGTLRVTVYDPKNNKNYFFLIPHKVYKPYAASSDSLKIWFDKNGNPRSPKRLGSYRVDLWNYECSANVWAGAK